MPATTQPTMIPMELLLLLFVESVATVSAGTRTLMTTGGGISGRVVPGGTSATTLLVTTAVGTASVTIYSISIVPTGIKQLR